jgi:hypothetical protein
MLSKVLPTVLAISARHWQRHDDSRYGELFFVGVWNIGKGSGQSSASVFLFGVNSVAVGLLGGGLWSAGRVSYLLSSMLWKTKEDPKSILGAVNGQPGAASGHG